MFDNKGKPISLMSDMENPSSLSSSLESDTAKANVRAYFYSKSVCERESVRACVSECELYECV